MNGETRELKIADAAADHAFRSLAGARGWDPDNIWIGGYVEQVWAGERHLMQAYLGRSLDGCRALEFGCNVGATAIVLARLGAVVAAVDIDAKSIALAEVNARRYGAAGISFAVLPPPPAVGVPFDSGSFDLVTCNSVLESVQPTRLVAPILRDFDRVLKPGGMVLVMGTSNRLAPREVHSRRWLANYLPRRVDAVVGRPLQRGVSPWRVRRGLPDYRDLVFADRACAYFAARAAAGFAPAKIATLRLVAALCRPLGWSVGMLTPSFFLALRKPGASRAEPMRPVGTPSV
jgi:2-polyprenyl-3-methyl-5-hydroxy-6-metoxy-1,4-benzoquinol methylase